MGISPTDDSPKYRYGDDGQLGVMAQYSKFPLLFPFMLN